MQRPSVTLSAFIIGGTWDEGNNTQLLVPMIVPRIPVGVAGSKRRVREVLRVHPLGSHLIVTASVPEAVSAVLETPLPVVEWQRLAPHPTGPRASRNFVSRTTAKVLS